MTLVRSYLAAGVLDFSEVATRLHQDWGSRPPGLDPFLESLWEILRGESHLVADVLGEQSLPSDFDWSSEIGCGSLGWEILVKRTETINSPSVGTVLLARWRVGLRGIEWLDGLVADGLADLVASNCGYPRRYEVKAAVLEAVLRDGPPAAGSTPRDRKSWTAEYGGVRDLEINRDELESLHEEVVIVDAWDQS